MHSAVQQSYHPVMWRTVAKVHSTLGHNKKTSRYQAVPACLQNMVHLDRISDASLVFGQSWRRRWVQPSIQQEPALTSLSNEMQPDVMRLCGNRTRYTGATRRCLRECLRPACGSFAHRRNTTRTKNSCNERASQLASPDTGPGIGTDRSRLRCRQPYRNSYPTHCQEDSINYQSCCREVVVQDAHPSTVTTKGPTTDQHTPTQANRPVGRLTINAHSTSSSTSSASIAPFPHKLVSSWAMVFRGPAGNLLASFAT